MVWYTGGDRYVVRMREYRIALGAWLLYPVDATVHTSYVCAVTVLFICEDKGLSTLAYITCVSYVITQGVSHTGTGFLHSLSPTVSVTAAWSGCSLIIECTQLGRSN